jgi:hypothetical protein
MWTALKEAEAEWSRAKSWIKEEFRFTTSRCAFGCTGFVATVADLGEAIAASASCPDCRSIAELQDHQLFDLLFAGPDLLAVMLIHLSCLFQCEEVLGPPIAY